MMAAFRAFAKSWAAMVLMGLLILAFGIWGVNDMFRTHATTDVVTAGSRRVSEAMFKALFTRQLRQVEQANGGQSVTAQEAAAEGFDRTVLQQLAEREAVLELIRRDGVKPSDTVLASQLRKFPVFFNPITGAFDRKNFLTVLSNNQMNEADFMGSLRDDVAQDHFLSGLFAGLRVPRTYTAAIAAFTLQGRSADYVVITPAMVGAPPAPTDAQLLTFMKANEAALRRPEVRQLSLVRISAAALAASQTVDPAEVQKRFDFAKGRLSTPEKRSFVQIPAKDPGQAQAISARLAKGEDPAAVARAYGAKPLTYADAVKSTVADPKVADAAFGLQPGQSSGPIQGQFGLAVVKVTSVTPGRAATLEEARPDIEKSLRADAAGEKANDQANKYQDSHDTGAPMDKAAQAAGVQIFHLGPLTAQGRGPDGQPVQGLNPRMLTEAFSLAQGGETDLVDLGKGEWYALRVDKVQPAAVPPFAELKPLLTRAFIQQATVDRVRAKAAAVAEQVKKGQSLAAAAGAAPVHLDNLSRAAASQRQDLGGEFLNALFSAKPGETFSAAMTNGIAVGKVTQIQPASVAEIAQFAEQGRPRLNSQIGQEDLIQLVARAATQQVKPKTSEALARSAIGVDEAPAPGKSAAKKP